MSFDAIEEVLEDIRAGKMIILCDDEDRENEGDLTIAAERVTPAAINFMARYGRGLICLALTEARADELRLPLMVTNNRSPFGTAFTVSIEARKGITDGISAADRATTVLTAIDSASKPEDLVRPGHVFPLRAKRGGVLVRAGQTEGSVDLARLSGLSPAAVICEVMHQDGTMARGPQLQEFCRTHGLKITTIKDLIRYRLQTESFIKQMARTHLPTPCGTFQTIAFENEIDGQCHVALVMGEIKPDRDILVRVHSQCLTGDVFGSYRCDCGEQLQAALQLIAQEGQGVLLYLQQEGRGIGLMNKLRSYALQDQGHDTVEANAALGFKPDLRDYGIGAQILRALGIGRMRLLTNNPRKIVGLEGYGLQIIDRVPLEMPPRKDNIRYLRAKQEKLGHLMTHLSAGGWEAGS
ncbi:MAG TPA: bifunctional 3,4-dihydroxy-2-butanone-4-phosphate synthase/GTP cyclohydrolase II [Candidatus Tectomicrobia bacterium]